MVPFVVNVLDDTLEGDAIANSAPTIYLRHMPKGIWVRMDKYVDAPFSKVLQRSDATLALADTKGLVFVEARTAERPFTFRGHSVSRTGWPLSQGRVITAFSFQGRTMKQGVILDCGRKTDGEHKKDDDDWWLDLYVMLSRATRMEDLLLMRAPPADFLLRGPPADLKDQLNRFLARTEQCREDAMRFIADLGFTEFLH